MENRSAIPSPWNSSPYSVEENCFLVILILNRWFLSANSIETRHKHGKVWFNNEELRVSWSPSDISAVGVSSKQRCKYLEILVDIHTRSSVTISFSFNLVFMSISYLIALLLIVFLMSLWDVEYFDFSNLAGSFLVFRSTTKMFFSTSCWRQSTELTWLTTLRTSVSAWTCLKVCLRSSPRSARLYWTTWNCFKLTLSRWWIVSERFKREIRWRIPRCWWTLFNRSTM